MPQNTPPILSPSNSGANRKSDTVNRKSAPPPGFKPTKLGWLPEEWEVVQLKEVCDKLNVGFVGTCKKHYTDQDWGVPLISTSNLYNGEFSLSNTNYVSNEFHNKNKKSQIVGGDILIARHSSSGSAVLLPEYIKEANSLNIVIVRVNQIHVIPYFCAEVINSYHVRKQVNAMMAGSSQKVVNTGDIAKLKIPLPPLPEQHRIAHCLTTWDRALSGTRQLLDALRIRKRGLMQRLLTGEVRLPGFSGEWEEVMYSEVLKKVKREYNWDDQALHPLISVRRRSGGIFRRDSLYGYQIKTKTLRPVNSGDFLISKMQIVHGASALTTDEFDGMFISGSYLALKPRDGRRLNIQYFEWHSKMPKFYHQTYIASYGVHIEKMTFNFKSFLKLKMLLPPLKEQTAIANVLTAADREIALYEQKLETLETQKRGLMQQLLTGQKRLPA